MDTLAQILSSQIRAAFFRILFVPGSPEFHLHDIQRQSGFAIGTVRQEAAKLTRLGLIVRRRSGNRVYLSANSLHPFYTDICSLVIKAHGFSPAEGEPADPAGMWYAFVPGSSTTGVTTTACDADLFVVG